jgi:NTP pyrophosphatase (non-canonical NTP hydrolase)
MLKTDSNTTLDDVKNWVREFCEERGWDPYHGPKDLAIGLVTESSELLELFRFVNETKSRDLVMDSEQRRKVADELADSVYFILRFAQMYGFDLSRCIQDKLVKNAEKYPAPQK